MPSLRFFVRAISILFLILIAASFIFSAFFYQNLESQVVMKLQTYGVLAFFLISLVLEFVPQYISPHIIIFSSPLFNINLFVVLLVTLIGSALGSSLGFAVGRLYGLHFAASLFSTKTLTKIIHAMNEHGRWYVLIAALSPLPFIHLIFGALHFSRRNFFWFGLIPRMLGLCVIAGIVKWFL